MNVEGASCKRKVRGSSPRVGSNVSRRNASTVVSRDTLCDADGAGVRSRDAIMETVRLV